MTDNDKYKVFAVQTAEGKKWQVFLCPSAPDTYDDKRPYDGKVYPFRQAAYRRCTTLNEKARKRVSA